MRQIRQFHIKLVSTRKFRTVQHNFMFSLLYFHFTNSWKFVERKFEMLTFFRDFSKSSKYKHRRFQWTRGSIEQSNIFTFSQKQKAPQFSILWLKVSTLELLTSFFKIRNMFFSAVPPKFIMAKNAKKIS